MEERPSSQFTRSCFLASVLREDGEKLKIFAPRPMTVRVMEEWREGFNPYFLPHGNEVKNGKTYNR